MLDHARTRRPPLPDEQAQVESAKREYRDLEAQVPLVVVTVPQAGPQAIRVRIDGRNVEVSRENSGKGSAAHRAPGATFELPKRLNPGRHTVLVDSPCDHDEQQLDLRDGVREPVLFQLDTRCEEEPAPASQGSTQWLRSAGMLLTGVGVGASVAGLTWHFATRREYNQLHKDCKEGSCRGNQEDAVLMFNEHARWQDRLVWSGIGAAVVGATLWWLFDDEELTPSMAVDAGAAVAQVSGRF